MLAKKAPPNIPDRGDRVRFRGRANAPGNRIGRLEKFDPENNWATIKWDDGFGPTYCHRFELERVDAS